VMLDITPQQIMPVAGKGTLGTWWALRFLINDAIHKSIRL
jgi:hypothetical protein